MRASRVAQILLVEDNKMDIELTLVAFREGHADNHIHVAPGGQAALDYLFGAGIYSNRELYPLPDLILLDLKMPVVDGHEVLRQVKHCDGTRRIPVIVLSSSKEEGDLALSYDGGANSYLVKPVSFEGFLKVVEKIDNYWLSLNIPPPMSIPVEQP